MLDLANLLWLGIAFVSGIVLGVFYFGGLWLTVNRIPFTPRPAFLSISSFIARMAVTMLGFYAIMNGRWERLVVALFGFLAVRCLTIRRWGPDRSVSDAQAGKGGPLAN